MERLPFSRRQLLAMVVAAVAALTLAGRYLAAAGTPAAEPPAAAPPAAVTMPALVVHVVGAVRRPGLYRLEQGDRIADAVKRAGGATRVADLTLVNLAAPVADGAQVIVPRRAPEQPGAGAGAEGGAGAGGASPAAPVHLNTATLEELDELPGVGPVTAQKIIDFRTENGPFTSVEDLDAIPGIGPARIENLRDLVAP